MAAFEGGAGCRGPPADVQAAALALTARRRRGLELLVVLYSSLLELREKPCNKLVYVPIHILPDLLCVLEELGEDRVELEAEG